MGGFGDWLVVEELGLVTSRFRRWDGRFLIKSTATLSKTTIDNLSRRCVLPSRRTHTKPVLVTKRTLDTCVDDKSL
eukprot:6135149-Pyramimonas_sp.AAC.1